MSSPEKTETPEERLIREFLAEFPNLKSLDPDPDLDPAEEAVIDDILRNEVDVRFSTMKYPLGLAIDFAVVAQRLSEVDKQAKKARPKLTEKELFERYERAAARGQRRSNTLTLSYGGVKEGIRSVEEAVVDLFHGLKRPDYPSAYVYNTGMWDQYKPLLVKCFSLSEQGRLELCKRLIGYGLEHLRVADFYGRATPRAYLFPAIISEYERSAAGENGGLTFQALTYGFLKADRPHLSIATDKVRRGSKRQKLIGDIDGFHGLDLDVTAEVKDLAITSANLTSELGEFIQSIEDTKARGIVFADEVDEDVRAQLVEKGIDVLTTEDLRRVTAVWDWSKQNEAVLGMLHFLAHIEQNPGAVQRLLEFIQGKDPSHDSLLYLAKDDED